MAKEITDALAKGTLLTSAKRTYRIEEVLGAGGFGITYRVSSEIMIDNVPVVTYFAVKEHFVKKACERKDSRVCSSSNNSDDVGKSRENFISEAKRLNKLSASHNNIVKVNECFNANDTAYYVMEYIDGPNLRTIIKNNGNKPLSWDDALKIILPIADAVSYLHDNRLTHLDIKPDNIILDSKKNNRPVLIDFGLSKHYDKKGNATSTIRITGCSDGYSPIEQYVGITTFSPKADVYSLAATLLYLVTGKDPVIATDLGETKIREAIDGKVPDYAVSALICALKKQHEDRTESVKEFIKGITTPANSVNDKENETENTTEVGTVSIERKPDNKPISKWVLLGIFIVVAVAVGCFTLFHSVDEHYVTLDGGARFYGVVDADGNPNGEGRLVDVSGKEYVGKWSNGDFDSGIMRTSNYEYDGTFDNMVPSGYGTAKYSDGRVYVGNWRNGEWNGLGKLTLSDGKISFGTFANNILTTPQPFNIGDICYGIDVSKWQRQIDWENLYLPADEGGNVTVSGGEFMQPALYALIKATDGKDSDDFYERNYQSAKRCGIVCGAYHYMSMRSSVNEQVRQFIKTSHLVSGDLPPILDLELPHDLMKNNRKEVCDSAFQWLKMIEKHYGVKPMIYTYYSFIKDYLTDPRFDNYEYFIAYHRPKLPYVKNWVFWQFTEEIKIPAIADNFVDVDVFNGNYSEFKKYLKKNGIKINGSSE